MKVIGLRAGTGSTIAKELSHKVSLRPRAAVPRNLELGRSEQEIRNYERRRPKVKATEKFRCGSWSAEVFSGSLRKKNVDTNSEA
jgi:hypothetical protein